MVQKVAQMATNRQIWQHCLPCQNGLLRQDVLVVQEVNNLGHDGQEGSVGSGVTTNRFQAIYLSLKKMKTLTFHDIDWFRLCMRNFIIALSAFLNFPLNLIKIKLIATRAELESSY